MTMHRTTPAGPQWARAIPAFAVGVLLAAWLIAGGAGAESLEYMVGRLAGAVLVTAALAMVLLWRSPLWFRLVWLAAYVCFLVGIGGAALHARERARENQAFEQDLIEAVEKMGSAIDEINAGRPRIDVLPEGAAADDRRYGEANFAFRSLLQARLDNHYRLEDDIKALDMPRLLEPENLRGPKARARVKERITAARTTVDDWVTRDREATQAFKDAWSRAERPEALRDVIDLAGMSREHERSLLRSRDAQMAMIDALEESADVLLRHRWTIRDEVLLFHDEAGLRAFEAAQGKLRQRGMEAHLAQMEMQSDLQKHMRALRRRK